MIINLNPQYEVGDEVMIINDRYEYSTFDRWVDKYIPNLKSKWVETKHQYLLGETGTIIAIGDRYLEEGNKNLYAIELKKGIIVTEKEGFMPRIPLKYLSGYRVRVIRRDEVYHSHNEWIGKFAKDVADEWISQIRRIPIADETGVITHIGINEWSDNKEMLFGIRTDDDQFHIMNGKGIVIIR